MRDEIKDLIEENMKNLKENSTFEENSISLEEKIQNQNKQVRENYMIKDFLEEKNKKSIEDLTEEERLELQEKLRKE